MFSLVSCLPPLTKVCLAKALLLTNLEFDKLLLKIEGLGVPPNQSRFNNVIPVEVYVWILKNFLVFALKRFNVVL